MRFGVLARLLPAAPLLGVLAATPLGAIEIDLQPSDHIYVNRLESRHQVYDLVVHGVRLSNPGASATTFEGLEIRATDASGREVMRRLTAADSRSGSAEIAAGSEMVFGAIYLATEFAPTQLIATATYLNGGASTEVTITLPVLANESEVAYSLPLDGTWYMRGIPSALSHHRWSMATEFAVDFFKVDEEGRISHDDPVEASNYYGYGAEVRAAADGSVEMVISGMAQDRPARMRREGEEDDAYGRRMSEMNHKAMQEYGLGGATGNLVVIRHANGERSAYGHLATGSLLVGEGDAVERGQVIARVGDTGDSPAVHLHFQIMEAEALRSIPFRFEDAEIVSPEFGSWVSKP